MSDTKFSVYRKKIAKERMKAAYDVLNALEDAYRKHYPIFVGDQASIDTSFKIFRQLIEPAIDAASVLDDDYKEICLGIARIERKR